MFTDLSRPNCQPFCHVSRIKLIGWPKCFNPLFNPPILRQREREREREREMGEVEI
jgi:hypothetical protein